MRLSIQENEDCTYHVPAGSELEAWLAAHPEGIPYRFDGTWRTLATVGYGQEFEVIGLRTLGQIRQEGFGIGGKVSLDGQRYRGIDSSVLFTLADGRLLNIPTIHVCR